MDKAKYEALMDAIVTGRRTPGEVLSEASYSLNNALKDRDRAVEEVALRLESIAADVRDLAARGQGGYEVQHRVLWGVANLSLEQFSRLDAEIARASALVKAADAFPVGVVAVK